MKTFNTKNLINTIIDLTDGQTVDDLVNSTGCSDQWAKQTIQLRDDLLQYQTNGDITPTSITVK